MVNVLLNNNYLLLFVFVVFVVLLSVILFFVSFNLSSGEQYNIEKVSPYECGFEPFIDTRVKFDVRFYLVGILFLVFDIELMFLYPWVLCLNSLDFTSILSMFVFLIILVIGFMYEWQKGALDWA